MDATGAADTSAVAKRLKPASRAQLVLMLIVVMIFVVFRAIFACFRPPGHRFLRTPFEQKTGFNALPGAPFGDHRWWRLPARTAYFELELDKVISCITMSYMDNLDKRLT